MFNNFDLNNKFIISLHKVHNYAFKKSVIYIFNYSKYGTNGLIINKTLDSYIKKTKIKIKINEKIKKIPNITLYFGGPLETDKFFVFHDDIKNTYSSSLRIKELVITTSDDIIESILNKKGPKNFLILLGYSYWKPGQIEQEFIKNYWLNTESIDKNIIFKVLIKKRLNASLLLLNVSFFRFSEEIGYS